MNESRPWLPSDTEWIGEINYLREIVKQKEMLIESEAKTTRKLRDELDLCRKTLETINEMACYASEENIDARASALLQIGECARSAIAKIRGE